MRSIFNKSLIFIALVVQFAYSQEFVPPIQNYSPNQYNAASQNWDISVGENGFIYVANNQGLLLFDGINWELHKLNGPSIIRSVYVAGDRIYTGSYQEIGYWEFDNKGQLNYTSLSPLLKNIKMESEEFWDILEISGKIYFRSFGAVYQYDGKEIKKISKIVSTSFAKYNEKLVVAQRRNGISFLDENGSFKSFINSSIIPENSVVVDLSTYKDQLFIGTRNNIFVFDGKGIKKFGSTELSNQLSKFELNHILHVSDNQVVFGTVKNGIIVYDVKQQTSKVFNRGSGLQNNTVLGMANDSGKLWLALDRGIDVIDLDSPINFYTDASGELGAVYDLAEEGENIYLASNTGIYNFKNGKLHQLENAEGHTWNLEMFENKLFANHNTGTYQIENGQFVPIDTRTGSFDIVKNPSDPNELFICHYTGISRLDLSNNQVEEIDSVNFPVKQLVVQGNEMWAAHPYEGLYHIILNKEKSVKEIRKLPPLDGETKNYKPRLYAINSQVVSFVNGKWYKYNPFDKKFEAFEEFESFGNQRLLTESDSNYFFVNENNHQIYLAGLDGEKLLLPDSEINSRLVKANENLIKENDSTLYVTLNDGFARINLSVLARSEKENNMPIIRQFKNDDSLFTLESGDKLSFKDSRNLQLLAGFPNSKGETLEYKIVGEDSLRGKVENGILNLRNLNSGSYEVLLDKAGNNFNQPVTFEFAIAPPWYLSNMMIVMYVLIFLAGVGLIIWFNKKKLQKHQLQLEEKFESEHKERLEKLEKQQLMHEIDVKRKELANTTMMAAKKNEVLMEIQSELNRDKVKFSNEYRLKHIMNKINRAVKNKDEWKVFETNFNEVHEDFFKEILERYPNLTNKDLKLCSYLKMNLSSKEIAPLMGISVRGVEVHRYRLRKKMELDSKTNLTKFLIKKF